MRGAVDALMQDPNTPESPAEGDAQPIAAAVQAYRIVVSAKMFLSTASVPSTSLRAGPSTSLRAGPSTSLRAGSEAVGFIVPRTKD